MLYVFVTHIVGKRIYAHVHSIVFVILKYHIKISSNLFDPVAHVCLYSISFVFLDIA